MKRNFERSLKLVLVHEGGWSNHPADPGGATMKGVIQRVYDAYKDRRGERRRSVRSITNDELYEIYRWQYWTAVHGDELPSGLDYCVFDAAMSSGPTQAAKWLQRALGGIKVDGHIGMVTMAAAVQCDVPKTIARMCAHRLRMLQGLKTWRVFGKGWGRRVAGVETKAIAMTTPAFPRLREGGLRGQA